jgi:hypothetical protein
MIVFKVGDRVQRKPRYVDGTWKDKCGSNKIFTVAFIDGHDIALKEIWNGSILDTWYTERFESAIVDLDQDDDDCL